MTPFYGKYHIDYIKLKLSRQVKIMKIQIKKKLIKARKIVIFTTPISSNPKWLYTTKYRNIFILNLHNIIHILCKTCG